MWRAVYGQKHDDGRAMKSKDVGLHIGKLITASVGSLGNRKQGAVETITSPAGK